MSTKPQVGQRVRLHVWNDDETGNLFGIDGGIAEGYVVAVPDGNWTGWHHNQFSIFYGVVLDTRTAKPDVGMVDPDGTPWLFSLSELEVIG